MGWNHDPDAIHSHQSGEIQALTEKTTPVDADVVVIEDSEDSNKKKKVKVANLGGGAETLDDLTDVDTTGVADGDALVYDADTSTWVPGEGGGGNASYSETIGDGSNTSFQIQHDLGTQDLVVQLWDLTGAVPVEATADADSIEATDADTVTVTFSAAPAADSYRVVVLASGGEASGGSSGGVNLALGRPYTTTTPNHVDGDSLWLGPSDSDYQTSRHLTDGIRPDGSSGSFGRAGCISWQKKDPTITFDFGSSVAVTQVRVFGTAGGGGVVTPDRIIVESSPDNSVWTSQADTGVLAAGGSSASGMRWAITMNVNASARYWRLLVTRGGEWTSIGEVEIIGVN